MDESQGDFLQRLKVALRGTHDAPLVFIGNFEVEDRWAEGEPGLPRIAFTSGNAVVNRMDEFALLLAGEDDHVVLKAPPDPDYLAFLSELGIGLPHILCVQNQDPQRVVTEDALGDDSLLARLRQLHAVGAELLPHGVSALEERLAAGSGMSVAGSSAVVCKAVNSKIYSRKLADELEIRQAPGWTCDNLEEWGTAVEGARRVLASGDKVVVKDAYGVSGKGIVVIEAEHRLLQLDRKIRSRAERSGSDRLALLIETWVGKRADLNYQVTVGRDGGVHFDFVKEAITAGGVHKGHRIPADLTPIQRDEICAAGERLGRRLAADGYRGVAGVDALVGDDGRLFPVIEINARSNMSTYQVRMQEAFLPAGQLAMALQYPVRLSTAVPFKRLRDVLDDVLLSRDRDAGLLVNNFATVNAAAPEAADRGAATFDGRLYGLIVAGSPTQLTHLDDEITRRLARLAEGTVA